MFPVSKDYINRRCGLHLDIYQKENPENSEELGIINSKGKFTKCAQHKHISRGEYKEVVSKIIQEFLNAGPEKTIQTFMELELIDIDKKYNDFCFCYYFLCYSHCYIFCFKYHSIGYLFKKRRYTNLSIVRSSQLVY